VPPGPALVVTAAVAGLGLSAGLTWLTLRAIGVGRRGWLTVGLAGLLLWCEPVYETVAFGQINLLVAVLVLADLVRPELARWRGALVGVAAGIKLTPLFFVLYLLVTRRFRAAGTALAGFGVTAVIGAAVLPGDSFAFWSGAFADPARVGSPEHPGNQSLRGLIARAFGDWPGQRLLWLAGAAVLAVLGLWLAARLSARGGELVAVLLCGLTATVVSPFSWVHHWVWVAALLIVLADQAVRQGTERRGTARRGSARRWAGLAVVAAVGSHWFFGALGGLHVPRWVFGDGYVWLTVALLDQVPGRVAGGEFRTGRPHARDHRQHEVVDEVPGVPADGQERAQAHVRCLRGGEYPAGVRVEPGHLGEHPQVARPGQVGPTEPPGRAVDRAGPRREQTGELPGPGVLQTAAVAAHAITARSAAR
jgi:alpha-1,2-mannosyltransferase